MYVHIYYPVSGKWSFQGEIVVRELKMTGTLSQEVVARACCKEQNSKEL